MPASPMESSDLGRKGQSSAINVTVTSPKAAEPACSWGCCCFGIQHVELGVSPGTPTCAAIQCCTLTDAGSWPQLFYCSFCLL